MHEFSLSVYAYAGAVLRFESPAQNEECKGEEMMEGASIFFSFLHPFKLFDEIDNVERLIVPGIKTGNMKREFFVKGLDRTIEFAVNV